MTLEQQLRFCVFCIRTRVRHAAQRGAALVEYALLVALIAVVSLGAAELMGKAAGAKLSSVGQAIGEPI
jgi:Flp pilus assembly pilin Flp